MSSSQLRPYFGTLAQFFRVSLANILQIVLMAALLLNWWGNHESTPAVQAVILQQHGDRILALEQGAKQFATDITQIKSDVRVLVAIADEQRKKQQR